MKSTLILLFATTVLCQQQIINRRAEDELYWYYTDESGLICVENLLLVFISTVAFFTAACLLAIGFQIYTSKKRSPFSNQYFGRYAKSKKKKIGAEYSQEAKLLKNGTQVSIPSARGASSIQGEIEMQTLKIE
ncbi:hypothetical protein FGO68_gene11007 [Halteria grandinella]|uniref:Uncharacterized protein n=1 Tax=Halteria grandinella TaxID=5974 RepID=A0A8J8SY46_HALGN|nr:hypothetical protein FGO68_gene11007 [Halteria grandinella]